MRARVAAAFVLALNGTCGLAPVGALAGTSVVECGQMSAYAPPDAGTPLDGSLTIGILPARVIAADATISAAVAAALPALAGTGPSCLSIDLNGAVITGLDFAAEGLVSGEVVVDSGTGWYLFADRLIVPTFVTDAYPGLAAIFATSAAAGTDVTATFFADTTTGQFTGFEATAAFCGHGDLQGDGDGVVGDAILPAAVLDAAASHALEHAAGERVCATVHSSGTIDQGGIATTTEVTITAVEAPPDTATDAAPGNDRSSSSIGLLALLAIVSLAVGAMARRIRDPSGRR